MKQKAVTLVTGVILHSTIFGFLLYFTKEAATVKKAIFQGLFFGVMISLFEVFVSPIIKNFCEKRNAKKN